MSSPLGVVITGVGVVSPIGTGKDAFWNALRDGKTGFTRWELADQFKEFPRFISPISDFDGKQHIHPRKAMKVMSRELQLAFAASMMAIKDAGLSDGVADPDRIGTVFGSELLYADLEEYEGAVQRCAAQSSEMKFELWGSDAMRGLNPLWMLKYLPNMAACHVGIAIDARGPNNTITTEETSGLGALIEAANCIRRGVADIMVTGATGNRVNPTRLTYGRPGIHSQYDGDAAGALRPFDLHRSGTVEGEGAGAIVLESESHARARNAPILARLAGWATSSCPVTSRFSGSRQALKNVARISLQRAEITARSLDHINAHGFGTIAQDVEESIAIVDCAPDTPVFAPKSYFGSLGAAAGTIELISSLLALDKGILPPTRNYEQPDPNCPLNVVAGSPRQIVQNHVLKLSQSLFGHACGIVVEKVT